MIHYHGTPLTPRTELMKMAGKNFCVSFADARDADWCLTHGQSVMWDSGSGVLVVGAALVIRDLVHESGGAKAALAAIGIGGLVAWLFAPPALVLASVLAFVLAELADLAVYAPLRQNRLWLAVLLSGLVGAAVDSAVFLWVAFGSLDFIAGQIVGKLWMSLIAAPFLAGFARRRAA